VTEIAAGQSVSSVRCGRFVDVVKGLVLNNVTLVVEGERIAEVRAGDGAPLTHNQLDLSDCTVVPGLIDLHTHLAGAEESGSYGDILMASQADDALIGVKNARSTIDVGFTTVRDVGSFRAFTDVSLRKAIDAGWIVGPRMHCSGGYITCTGGGGEVTGFAADVHLPETMRVGVADNADEVRKAVRRFMSGGADFIKVIATGAVLAPGTNPGASEFSEAEIRAAVEEAALYGAPVAAHAHGAEGIKRATRAGVRSIEHGSFADDEALKLMAEAGTYLVADVWAGDWMQEVGKKDGWPADTMKKIVDSTETQRDAFRRALQLGVRIGFGTDSGIYPHGMNIHQLPKMVELGLSPMNAIRSATVWAAECLGSEDVGTLELGRYADLVAIKGHDLEDLSPFVDRMHTVIKGGTVIKTKG
jgi:imidazolonepropionase-like amidohydrolase